ncbi:type IV secretory system conjugative DNA transfer family protein [Chryseobacterium sp. NFX27]|uniref:type IV secretory system conjugative DNA transfer family protein n=1 Tax=Chryseobacterium sp. NFX27 TaxID=2819618 RepID=UPI003CF7844D
MKILDLTLRNWLIIISAILILTLILFGAFKSKNKIVKLSLFFICLGFIAFTGMQLGNYLFPVLYLMLPSLAFSGLIYAWSYEKPVDPIWDIEFMTSQGKKVVRGVARGIAIFGSAGSGKTVLIYTIFLIHFARARFAGLIYDFKNGELTELALPLFKDRLRIIALHNPEISVGCNPIYHEYLHGEKDINQIVKVILDNLINNGVGKGDDFFKDSASSLLAGVMMKFWLDHKEFCTLPHIIAFILAVDFSVKTEGANNLGEEATAQFGKLKDFLTSNKRVAIQGSTFILGLASSKQTASVVSTLANALRKIAFPEAFYILSRNDIDFNINDEKVDLVISVMNEPKSVEFLSPINACIIHTITKQMMNRGRKQSFILLDEAPTIKLLNMAQIPATMRSFGVSTIYCAQDIVQGVVQYGRDGFKEIIANLSTQFFGKANDADTAKFYEGYFELVKEKTKSTTQKGGDGNLLSTGDKSTTTSEREVSKHRAHEFTKLKVGQFAFLSDGNNEIVNVVAPKIVSEKITSKKQVSQQKLESNFNKILDEANSILG